MPLEFVATDLSISEEDWGLLTVLGAPSQGDEDNYLMLQRANSYDAQATELGLARPYLEFMGQGWSWYGHIISFELFTDHIAVQMDEVAAKEMESDGAIRVRFNLSREELEALQTALDRTFAGEGVFHSRL
jgi:hypothetical protein